MKLRQATLQKLYNNDNEDDTESWKKNAGKY